MCAAAKVFPLIRIFLPLAALPNFFPSYAPFSCFFNMGVLITEH